MGSRISLALLLLLLVAPTAFSAVNVSVSKDWRVAYLLGYYSHMGGDGFLAADNAANAKEVIPYLLPKNDEIVVYEDDDPFVKNYEAVLRGMGFTNVRTVKVSDPYTLNFDLMKLYGPFDCYVIVPDSSGEWIYSAGAYAFAKGCAVLLLNNRTIDRIIAEVPADADVTIVGYEGKRLREAFPNALIIATGNKAADSVELAKRFPKPFDQVFLVSGMYLYLPGNAWDPPIWTGGGGRYPVLIAYPDGVPEVVKQFILEHVKVVSFIGPELDAAFGRFREEVGDKVKSFILINVGYQGVPTRDPGTPYPLPVLVLPTGDVRIDLESVSALPEGNLFLVFRNVGEAVGYVLPTYIRISCGDLVIEPELNLEPVPVYGRDYSIVEIYVGEPLPQEECVLYLEARYGPDKDRLMFEFNKELRFRPQAVEDPTELAIERVVYSPRYEAFIIYVRNESPVRAYVIPEVVDVLVDGIPTTFKGRVSYVEPNSTGKLYVKALLTEADLIDNPEVKVVLRYGKSRDLPVKVTSAVLPLEKETLTDVVVEFIQENWLLVGAALALLIILLLILRRK